MDNFKDAENKADLLAKKVIDKLVKSTNYSNRAIEDFIHVRHGFISAV